MSSIRNDTLLHILSLGVLVFCLGGGAANAQSFRGTFSLPNEVRWGAATLQPGAYTFTSEGARNGYMVRLIQGRTVVATLLSQSHDLAMAGRAKLVMDQSTGSWTVREIHLPERSEERRVGKECRSRW